VVVSAVFFVQLHQTWMPVLLSASSLTGQELFWIEKEETFS
jgi:hypothetical protein